MITALSRREIKRQKAQVRLSMKEMRIKIKDVAESLSGQWHINSVYRTLNVDLHYCNMDILTKVQEIIAERKQPIKL